MLQPFTLMVVIRSLNSEVCTSRSLFFSTADDLVPDWLVSVPHLHAGLQLCVGNNSLNVWAYFKLDDMGGFK